MCRDDLSLMGNERQQMMAQRYVDYDRKVEYYDQMGNDCVQTHYEASYVRKVNGFLVKYDRSRLVLSCEKVYVHSLIGTKDVTDHVHYEYVRYEYVRVCPLRICPFK